MNNHSTHPTHPTHPTRKKLILTADGCQWDEDLAWLVETKLSTLTSDEQVACAHAHLSNDRIRPRKDGCYDAMCLIEMRLRDNDVVVAEAVARTPQSALLTAVRKVQRRLSPNRSGHHQLV